MSMLLWVLVQLAWPAVAVYAIVRIVPVAAVELEARRPQRNAVISAEDSAVPDDILAWAMGYPDAWAQDDALRVVRERYADHKDWNKVRRAIGLGVREERES